VRDISTDATFTDSDIDWMANVNGRLFFQADDFFTTASELWVSDGTTGGTRVIDIDPGLLNSTPDYITNFNGVAYFGANQTQFSDGQEPWRSDGTFQGTRRLANIDASAGGGGNPQNFTPSGSQLFFTADDGSNGRELWVTDGTSANTRLVADIEPGVFGGLAFNERLVDVNGVVYFAADDGINGEELWRSDGTAAGTFMVADLSTGVFSSLIDEIVNVNGTLYFSAFSTSSGGRRLWKSDGTAAGTVLVNPVGALATDFTSPRELTNYNGFLAFVAGGGTRANELWISDGTVAGTAPAEAVRDTRFVQAAGLTVSGQVLFFRTQSTSTLARFRLSEPPTGLNLIPNTVPENSPIGTSVGTFSPVDPDMPNDTFTFRLVTNAALGPDNGLFRVTGDQLEVNVANLNFEAKTQYRVFAEVTDRGGNTFAGPLTINVTDVNEAPTDLSFSPGVVVENRAPGSLVGNFQPTDPDRTSQTYTYALVAGVDSDDNALFSISGNTVVSNATFDFEVKNSFKIRVEVTDNGGQKFEKAFQVLVLDDNEQPTLVALTGNTVLENQPEGTVVGTVSGTDPDAGDTLTFSVESTSAFPDGSFFSILGGNKLVTNQKLDFETKPVYNVLLRVTDQAGAFFQRPFAVNVTNLDDVATTITLSNVSVDENRPAGTTVGTLSTLSPAYAATLRFELSPGAGGEDNGLFQIVGNSLQIAPGATVNFEQKSQLAIRVKATDPTNLAFEERFVINVRDLNEAPAPLTLGNNSVSEAQLLGTLVGLLKAPDPEQLDTVTFSLVAGPGSTDNAKFRIFGSGLQTNAVLSFDTQKTLSVRVRASDQNGAFTDAVFTINVTQVPKAFPMFRAFNVGANYHFYTTRQAEFQNALNGGYRDERSSQNSFQVLQQQVTGASPLYRLYNFQTGRHYYTVSLPERDSLVAIVPTNNPNFGKVGWRSEPAEGFLYPVAAPNTVEIFRLYNTQTGAHLFTPSVSEMSSILSRFPGIWVQHSSLGFGFVAPANSAGASAASAAAEVAAPVGTDATQPSAAASSGATNVATLVAAPVSRSATASAALPAPSGDGTSAPVAAIGSDEADVDDAAGLDSLFSSPLLGDILN
jgi:ELWxxDGT repeat protein